VVSVKTAKIVEGDAILTVNAFGKTDALKKEKIYAPIAGRIVSLKVFEGTQVKKGEVVASIQSKESQSAILGAESMLRTATTPAQKADAEQALMLARTTQNTVSIAAKFDGYVSTRTVSEGELVVENGELLTIIDPSTVDFLADVQLRDLPTVRLNQRASIEFQSLPGKTFRAVVSAVNPQSDIQSQTVKVRLQLLPMDNILQSLLRTEMMGTARIVTGVRRHALFVPKSALLHNDEESTYSVVTVTPDSLAKSIAVTIGMVTDSTSEVQSTSLHPGTTVITVGNYSLSDSTRVTISHQDGE
jgi:RND family efflux transporter MFP subunit